MRRRNLKLFAAGCNLLFLMPFICYVCGILFLAGFRDWRQSEKQRANMLNDSYLFAIDLQRLFGDEWESSPVRINNDQTDVLDWNPEVAGSAEWVLSHPELEPAFVYYQVFTFLSPRAANRTFERYLGLFGSRDDLVLYDQRLDDTSEISNLDETSYLVRCWHPGGLPDLYLRCRLIFLYNNYMASLTMVSVMNESLANVAIPAVVAAIDATLVGHLEPGNQ